MRVATLFPLILLAICAICGPPFLTGCAGIPAEDAKAQALTYNAVWPWAEKGIEADATLKAEDKSTYKDTGVTWRDKIAAALKAAKVPHKFENGKFTLNERPRPGEWLFPDRTTHQLHATWDSVTLEGVTPDRRAPFDRLTVRMPAGFGPARAG